MKNKRRFAITLCSQQNTALLAHGSLFFHKGFVKGRSDFCNLDPEAGPCMAYFPRFYFDRHAGHCKMFVYGGCNGNQNNFEKEEDCEKTCGVNELK